MGDDAGVTGRDKRGLGWLAAAAGGFALFLALAGLGESWGAGDHPRGVSVAIVLLAASASLVIVLTVVAAGPRATSRSATAGLACAALELVAVSLASRWQLLHHDLSDIGTGLLLVPARLHAIGSFAGFAYAWHARHRARAAGVTA
ncbi:hypothetical protein [Demequina soli]|uniref:hypothetical protein n=1 Tax=Demequina soli TaxID=1638987 RepID=UPI000781AEDA|nr:hypothetical protein [Demequina soli]